MLLLSGRRAHHITFWLTLLLNQLWTRTPQFSWLACRKEEWWCWEKANLPDQGRTISNQSVYSIKIQSHENSGAIQYWAEEMTRKHPPDEASCFWELASAQLLFLFRFYSSTFLLKFSLSDTIDVHVCVHTRAQERVFVVCKSEPPRGYFKISFSWTVQTMNSYDSVSKLCWEGKNYMHSLGHYIWSAKLKLYKIIVEKSIFETKHKDPKHGKKQLEFRKLTMSGPLLQFIIIWVTLCNSSVLQN